jgi:hypothetical protein
VDPLRIFALVAETDAIEFAARARRVTKQEDERVAIGQTALGDFEDLVRDSAGFVEDVEIGLCRAETIQAKMGSGRGQLEVVGNNNGNFL